jgi:hypothetical protein
MSIPFSWKSLAELLRLLYLFSCYARGLRMNSQDLILASLPETQLTLGGLLQWLRTQGRLAPLVREALAAQLVREQACKADLSGTAEARAR